MTEYLMHNKVRLALHSLKSTAEGRPLLVLHGLGMRSPGQVEAPLETWRGPIYALDFTGHGESTIPKGGGYTAEVLMGDADAALGAIGPVTVLGYGLGAYVALLLCGARPKEVMGAILCDGPGLTGGGPAPGSPYLPAVNPNAVVPPDPWALAELARDIRPEDYATNFLRQATQFSELEHPVTVCAGSRPPWLDAVASEPGVKCGSLKEALEEYSSA